tara:strand:+ start:1082 stop:1303 length:222 start_codon:yes stop_codon:yes gene_type:complete
MSKPLNLADPSCLLCEGEGRLEPEQSRGITHTIPCLCVASAQQEMNKELERSYWKDLIKEAVLEAFNELPPEG